MEFRIRKFLTMSMLFSMFGGFVSGMENKQTLREGWNFVYKAECPQGDIDVIIFNKFSPKYYCLKELYNKTFGEKLTKFISQTYNEGASCLRCNQRFVNSKNTSDGNDPAHHFENCDCKLCHGCAVTMENFSDYKCSEHGNKLIESAIGTIELAKVDYDYFKALLKNEDPTTALNVMANAHLKYLKSQGKDYNDIEKLKERIREYTNMQGYNGVKNSYDTTPRACACDILSSAINFQRGKGLFNGCPNCRTNNHPVCIPQCGHPICLGCLKNFEVCSKCKTSYYRIVVLKEGIDEMSTLDFIDQNKQWFQKNIEE